MQVKKINGVYPSESKKAFVEYTLEDNSVHMLTYKTFIQRHPDMKDSLDNMIKDVK